MTAWQPIETAPIDTTVLVYITETDQESRLPFMTTAILTDHWRLVEGGWLAMDDAIDPAPTHWHPLPEPPK